MSVTSVYDSREATFTQLGAPACGLQYSRLRTVEGLSINIDIIAFSFTLKHLLKEKKLPGGISVVNVAHGLTLPHASLLVDS